MAEKPKKWQLIELGPGRGTLMADMLRVIDIIWHYVDVCMCCV